MEYRIRVTGRRLWEGDTAFQIRTGRVFTGRKAEARIYADAAEAERAWGHWSRELVLVEPATAPA